MQRLFPISTLLLLLYPLSSLPDQDFSPWQPQRFCKNSLFVDELIPGVLPKRDVSTPILKASEHWIYDGHTNLMSIFQDLVPTRTNPDPLRTCPAKSASHDIVNMQQQETFKDDASETKQHDQLKGQELVSQGFCFNSKPGFPEVESPAEGRAPAPAPAGGEEMVPPAHQAAISSTTNRYQLLKNFYIGEGEQCLTGGQRISSRAPSFLENQSGGFDRLLREEQLSVEKETPTASKEEPGVKKGFWWWTALTSSKKKTCPWKTLLQIFLEEVEQVLRRYRLKVEKGKQAWLGRACSRRSGGGGWWNSCGVIVS